ncbi:MAG: elongation factor P [Candidatus Paceibacterota bacterium]
MSLLEYNEITEKKYIVLEGAPYEVISSHVFRKQQRKPVNATKLKNLLTGKVTEYSFHQSEKVEEAEIEEKEVKYLYTNRGEHWFCDPEDPKNRFTLSDAIAGDVIKWTKTNTILEGITFEDKVIGIRPPIKVVLKVTECAPAVRGDTSGNALKTVVVETGAKVNVPMFINEGDTIEINTESGDYTNRVEKA